MKPSIIPFKNRTVDISKPVYLYRNLHLKEKGYSIKQSGKVVGRVYNNFFLQCCEFIILESERNRYLRTKQRNVHALVKGIIAESCLNAFSYPLYYDLNDGYFLAYDIPIKHAKCVYISNNEIKVQI